SDSGDVRWCAQGLSRISNSNYLLAHPVSELANELAAVGLDDAPRRDVAGVAADAHRGQAGGARFVQQQPQQRPPEMPPKLQVQRLPSTLRNEDDVIFALPRWVA